MDSNALMAALGMDAVAAVRGYRAAVVGEAARRGLRLVHHSHWGAAHARRADPLVIRLTVHGSGRADLAGRELGWSAASGWWSRCPRARDRARFYAGPADSALDLVPSPTDVVGWATAARDDDATGGLPPDGVDLEDDPAALHRLIEFTRPRSGLRTARGSGRGSRTAGRRPRGRRP